MKTKEEILEHLSNTGYEEDAVMKILGYLLGAGTIKKGETVNFTDGCLSFDDFFDWINEKPKENKFQNIAASLDYFLGFISNRKVPKRVIEKTKENINFLMKNKEYLQECMDKKEEAEAFLDDVTEVLEGFNKSLESIFKK